MYKNTGLQSLGLAVARYLLPSIKLLMLLPKNNDFETYSVDSRFSEGKSEPVLSTGPVDLAKNFDQKPKPKTSVNRESTVRYFVGFWSIFLLIQLVGIEK